MTEQHKLRVFDNGMLRKTFGPTRDEVPGEWRRPQNAELYDLYSSPIIPMIKSRSMRWVGHVARIEDKRGAYIFWCGNVKERDNLGDLDTDGRIILKWIFKKWDGDVWTGLD